MSKGCFTDKNTKPDDVAVENALGTTYSQWNFLVNYLHDRKVKGEYKFYGINYGWALRFTKSGRSIVAFYPGNNTFMMQVILNTKQVEAALVQLTNLSLLHVIHITESIHEGKWIYFPIDTTSDLQDIRTLIDIRMKINSK
jgi:hypothetical protein